MDYFARGVGQLLANLVKVLECEGASTGLLDQARRLEDRHKAHVAAIKPMVSCPAAAQLLMAATDELLSEAEIVLVSIAR